MKKLFTLIVHSLVFVSLIAAAASVLADMFEKKKEKEYLSKSIY